MNPLKFCDSNDPQTFYTFLFGMCFCSGDYYQSPHYFFHPNSEWVTIDKITSAIAVKDLLLCNTVYS